jgi:hypothetical protein
MGISEATFRRWKQLYGALAQPRILLFESRSFFTSSCG